MPVKQIKNRGQFKAGVSGNPNGRPPKRICIPDLLKEIGDEEVGDSTKLRLALNTLFNKAIKGNIRAIELICRRMEGRVPMGEIKSQNDLPKGFEVVTIGMECKTCKEIFPDDD